LIKHYPDISYGSGSGSGTKAIYGETRNPIFGLKMGYNNLEGVKLTYEEEEVLPLAVLYL
jgi:hypothetical protein